MIEDYQAAVSHAVGLMLGSGIARPASGIGWAALRIPQQGKFADGSRYFKHGFGCAVRTSSFVVDFDFGDRGQIDGFDFNRVWEFATQNRREHGFRSEAEAEVAFNEAVASGELTYSGKILYYLRPNG